jgi:hypothetical protein
MKQYKILVIETEVVDSYDEWEDPEVTQKVYEYDTFLELTQKWKDKLPAFEQTQYNTIMQLLMLLIILKIIRPMRCLKAIL